MLLVELLNMYQLDNLYTLPQAPYCIAQLYTARKLKLMLKDTK
jgi:hypothetical protein